MIGTCQVPILQLGKGGRGCTGLSSGTQPHAAVTSKPHDPPGRVEGEFLRLPPGEHEAWESLPVHPNETFQFLVFMAPVESGPRVGG